MVCKGCNRQSRQVVIHSSDLVNLTTEEIKKSLRPSKSKALLEVIKGPWSHAYLHFKTNESASVFFHQYSNKQLIVNGVVFSVQAAKYPNGHQVKYAFKQINFTGSSAASASTNTNATAVSALSAAAAISVRASAPAAAHSRD
ncbi:unnamed protein product [Mucor circinelloides]|uniref:RRM domain-containing protein n=1 Tax=Mucor circinelloides f. circinelloides (strain 1006PhL) TaxID=1220926 RepID=S2JF25_MUCC1|nr:hypothetical protein HMPREF1544_04375 [Mucor circinelloides 1006PhL]